jgi:hypothetical protein
MPACVISGEKSDIACSLPKGAVEWRGHLQHHQRTWEDAAAILIASNDGIATARDDRLSPYSERFRQGAVLVPRMLLMVEEIAGGRIGMSAGRRRVRSARSSNEKAPWKGLPSLEGVVEERFLHRVHLGSTMVGYRARSALCAVIPLLDKELIDGSDDRLDEFPGLAEWWREAEEIWNEHRSPSTRLTLREQINYQTKLSKQVPIAQHRVIYTASGQHLAACRVEAEDVLIEKALYWGPVDSVDEGRYLCAILNSDRLAEAIRPLQARGQHNPRHFDMHVFAAGFPLFDPEVDLHQELTRLAGRAESIVGSLEFDLSRQFQHARRAVRDALREDGVAAEIDIAVANLLLQGSKPTKPRATAVSPLDALPSPTAETRKSKAKRLKARAASSNRSVRGRRKSSRSQ